jgi:hypothetical protein
MDTTDDNAESASLAIDTNDLNASSGAVPEDAPVVHLHQETNATIDSGIESESAQSLHGSTENSITDQPSIAATAALTGFQLAEEQDLTPDVRRVPKQQRRRWRRRCRKAVDGEQRYDFDYCDRSSTATRLSGATRACYSPAASWLACSCFVGDADVGSRESTTTSLTESIWNYRKEHGRTYHGW